MIYGKLHDELYCYPGTDVLKNLFDIRDQESLQYFERRCSEKRESQLRKSPSIRINGFGLDTLARIHRFLFQDVYSWAGHIREIDISKGGVRFQSPEKIKKKCFEVKKYISENKYFIGMSDGQVIKNLALVHNALNTIHPFREGNGRTIRLFMQLLAAQSGWELNFSNIAKAEMNNVSRQGVSGNVDSFVILYAKIASKREKNEITRLPEVVISNPKKKSDTLGKSPKTPDDRNTRT